MSSLLAKNLGAKRVVTIVNRSSYVDLLEGNKIDIVVSPHLITIGSILAHIRRGDIVAVHPSDAAARKPSKSSSTATKHFRHRRQAHQRHQMAGRLLHRRHRPRRNG